MSLYLTAQDQRHIVAAQEAMLAPLDHEDRDAWMLTVQVPPATFALRRRAEILHVLGNESQARELGRRVRERWVAADSGVEEVINALPPLEATPTGSR